MLGIKRPNLGTQLMLRVVEVFYSNYTENNFI